MMGLALGIVVLSGIHDAPVQTSESDSAYVVQPRRYLKQGRLEILPLVFSSVNNRWVHHAGAAVGVTYHFRENLGLELLSSVPGAMIHGYSSLVDDLRQPALAIEPDAVDLKQLRYFATLGVLYAPFAGKLVVGGSLWEFDLYLSGGAGVVATVAPCELTDSECGEEQANLNLGLRAPSTGRFRVAGHLGIGMRAYFSQRWGLRLEMRDLFYPDMASLRGVQTKAFRQNVLLSLGLSVLL